VAQVTIADETSALQAPLVQFGIHRNASVEQPGKTPGLAALAAAAKPRHQHRNSRDVQVYLCAETNVHFSMVTALSRCFPRHTCPQVDLTMPLRSNPRAPLDQLLGICPDAFSKRV
jgi:hypothetical protein